MINLPLKILDNVGCLVYSENDHFEIVSSLSGFKNIDASYKDSKIPYICKNKDQYEIGIGLVSSVYDRIIIYRDSIIASSADNQKLVFSSSTKNYFYCFANSTSFNTAFNNLIEVSGVFEVSDCRSFYAVNVSESDALAVLPDPSLNRSLVVEFQTSSGNHTLSIQTNNGEIIDQLLANTYCKFISTGSAWLKIHTQPEVSASFAQSQNFSAMNTLAAGSSGSLQYNDGSYLAGADLYVDDTTNSLLIGGINYSTAHTIIPFSGDTYSVVFNNLKKSADFIVNGSGDKSLFFGSEGRLGINIPSGSRPQTSLHIINNACQEGIRLENRNQCYPANLTLYHKPSTLPADGSLAATLNLSGKNSSNNQIQYSQLRSRILSANTASSSGELAIATDKAGVLIESFVTNADETRIVAGDSEISVSTSGVEFNGSVSLSGLKWPNSTISGQLLMSDGSGNIVLTSPNNSPIIDLLDAGVVVFTGVCT